VERRLAAFFILTVLVWGSFLALQLWLAPPQPPAQQAADGKLDKGKREVAKKDADQPPPPAKEPLPPELEPSKPELAAPEGPEVAQQRVVLGSLDPASGYSGLYYFDNRGGALDCVELYSPKYNSVEDYSGYLGRLSPVDAKDGGAEITVVGAGTPAASALASTGKAGPGLQVGDVIKSIDGRPVIDKLSVEEYLQAEKKPGQAVILAVVRSGVAEPIDFTATLTRRPLELLRPEHRQSLLMTLDRLGPKSLRPGDYELAGLPSLYRSNWTLERQGEDFVEFSFTLDEASLTAAGFENAGPLKIVKRYSVAKAENPGNVPYHVDFQIAIQNLSEEPLNVAYRLAGLSGLPLEGWWYSTKLSPAMWTAAGARDVAYKQAGLRHQLMGCPAIVNESRKLVKDNKPQLLPLIIGDRSEPFDYVGVDTQFFAGAVQPLPAADGQRIRYSNVFAMPVQDVTTLSKTRQRTADVSFRMTTAESKIEAGGELRHEYRVFLGPKDPPLLSAYDLGSLIEYGWSIFAVPAKMLRSVLNGLYWLTSVFGIPNYGIAIILLTVIVRTCMIPVSLKQARSAAKMQELAPEIQKIKDKFPDDPMKQHQAVQELYKKHDFNMFGGCLPVFIQLPIFIGLYRCLSVDIDLRNAALIPGIRWASDLAGPDKLFYWKDWMPAIIADEADGYFGPFFNVFPLITVALFLVQQKMFTPPATDEQTKMQQQMMTIMTVVMGVLFYKVPAGLCIYFITSSLWGITERKLLPKSKPKDAPGGGVVAKLPAKPASPNGSSKPTGKRPKQRR
jgi:YidC/Oxa1 family membrane protein insertase